jgi:hypothetical protein
MYYHILEALINYWNLSKNNTFLDAHSLRSFAKKVFQKTSFEQCLLKDTPRKGGLRNRRFFTFKNFIYNVNKI